jgi:hypothetical protein
MLWTVLLFTACGPSEPAPVLHLPERAGAAPGGDEISREIRNLELRAREEWIYTEISQGNVPTWIRQLRPVEVRGEVGGRRHRVTFWVTPDYLAVGSEGDYLLIPLSAQTAQRIADLVRCSLPTPRMVDAIWASLLGSWSPATSLMSSLLRRWLSARERSPCTDGITPPAK